MGGGRRAAGLALLNPPFFSPFSLPLPLSLFLPFPLLSRFSVLSNRSYDHEKIACVGNGFMIVDF